jgi:hypothetical protein
MSYVIQADFKGMIPNTLLKRTMTRRAMVAGRIQRYLMKFGPPSPDYVNLSSSFLQRPLISKNSSPVRDRGYTFPIHSSAKQVINEIKPPVDESKDTKDENIVKSNSKLNRIPNRISSPPRCVKTPTPTKLISPPVQSSSAAQAKTSAPGFPSPKTPFNPQTQDYFSIRLNHTSDYHSQSPLLSPPEIPAEESKETRLPQSSPQIQKNVRLPTPTTPTSIDKVSGCYKPHQYTNKGVVTLKLIKSLMRRKDWKRIPDSVPNINLYEIADASRVVPIMRAETIVPKKWSQNDILNVIRNRGARKICKHLGWFILFISSALT